MKTKNFYKYIWQFIYFEWKFQNFIVTYSIILIPQEEIISHPLLFHYFSTPPLALIYIFFTSRSDSTWSYKNIQNEQGIQNETNFFKNCSKSKWQKKFFSPWFSPGTREQIFFLSSKRTLNSLKNQNFYKTGKHTKSVFSYC